MGIQEKIGYSFKIKTLCERALTRKALSNEKKGTGETIEDQEIYRTLGDAVLEVILVDYLIRGGAGIKRRNHEEKDRTGVKKDALADLAKELDIADDILTNNGEEKQGAENQPYVLAETLEAVLGAIYLDGGYCSAMDCVLRWYGPEVFSLPQKS